jgi:hypothetical protein
MAFKSTIPILLLASLSLGVNAQLRVPSFDVALKTGYYMINDGNDNSYKYESIPLHAEVNGHVNQHIAIGYFYQRSVYANYHGSGVDISGDHLMHGVNIRLSSGRAPKFRPYLNVKYFSYQTVVNFKNYNVASKGNGASAGFGLMVRLSHRLYLNVAEAEIGGLLTTSEVLFNEKKAFLQARTGVTYNFSRRK